MFTPHPSSVLDVPLRFLAMGRPWDLGEGPGSLSTGEGRGALASVSYNTYASASVF